MLFRWTHTARLDARGRRFLALTSLPLFALCACSSTSSSNSPHDAGMTGDNDATDGTPTPVVQSLALNITAVDTTFATRDHFMAAVEMQLSGEPLAEAMGRDLSGYSRDYACPSPYDVCDPSIYNEPVGDGGLLSMDDMPGFASAVESYEYSKQPMNNIAFESGAGTFLGFGPLINPNGVTGADALAGMRAWVQQLAPESNATSRFVASTATADNPLGWPGLWPTLQPFSQWDPTIQASNASTGCSISSDDDPGATGSLACDDYECDYTTLHLPNRAAQVTSTIDPGSSGWAAWKEALWTLNYLQSMHDSQENAVTTVPAGQLAMVGMPNNTVLGNDDGSVVGTFLGSSDIEGFQAGNFLQMLDNQSDQWLTQLTTADGTTLGGFASVGAALAYSPTDPLRWLPGFINVDETSDASGFPRPSGYTIASADSHLLDLAGLLGAYSSVYSLTDQSNTEVGGSQPVMAYFDGDPFPVQNQTPTGASTLHDRTLALGRVLVVNMDRLHFDPTTNLPVDDVTMAGNVPTRGTTLSTDVAAYALLALRTERRALDGLLTLYSNTRPDEQGVPTPLDGFAQVDGMAFGARLDQLIASLSQAFMDKFTTSDGTSYSGWDFSKNAPTDTGTALDAHSAAIRGALVAYLATGNTAFRDRALAVYDRLDSAFYDPTARVYRTTAGDTSNTVVFTPRRFGLLQGALRDTLELIGVSPGQATLLSTLEDRIARLDKLVLNGWDDRDEDGQIEWPGECAQMGTGPDGQPMAKGGLQMAERVLSGESGSLADTPDAGDGGARVITTDREHDCVPEISAAGLPAALANSITFTLSPISQ